MPRPIADRLIASASELLSSQRQADPAPGGGESRFPADLVEAEVSEIAASAMLCQPVLEREQQLLAPVRSTTCSTGAAGRTTGSPPNWPRSPSSAVVCSPPAADPAIAPASPPGLPRTPAKQLPAPPGRRCSPLAASGARTQSGERRTDPLAPADNTRALEALLGSSAAAWQSVWSGRAERAAQRPAHQRPRLASNLPSAQAAAAPARLAAAAGAGSAAASPPRPAPVD
jgi:hypothetical protein